MGLAHTHCLVASRMVDTVPLATGSPHVHTPTLARMAVLMPCKDGFRMLSNSRTANHSVALKNVSGKGKCYVLLSKPSPRNKRSIDLQ